MTKREKRGPVESPAEPTKPMTAAVFVREFAARQKPLLEAMRDSIQRGEVHLEFGAKSDRHVERVITAWCDDDEPDIDQHMRMLGAVFLVALYDELYAADAPSEGEIFDADNSAPGYGASAADVAVEVLRTIQSIWGIHGSTKTR